MNEFSRLIVTFVVEFLLFLIFLAFFLGASLCYLSVIMKKKDKSKSQPKHPLHLMLLHAFSYSLTQMYATNLFLSVLSLKKPLIFVMANILLLLLIALLGDFPSTTRYVWLRFAALISSMPITFKIAFAMTFLLLAHLALSSFFYPPAGTDDMGYRLPVVFESLRDGKLFIPNELCDPRMAFPQFPYTIFEAYVLISGSDRFIDFSNIVFAILGALAVYSIARQIGSHEHVSFLLSLLSFTTPVFVGQMRSNYVDLAFSSLLVSSLALQMVMLRSKNTSKDHLIPMSIFTGTLLGTKYTGLLFIPAFEIVLIRTKGFLVGNIIAATVSSPYYLINLVRFGFFVYPEPWSELGKKIYPQGENILNTEVFVRRYVRTFLAFLKYDNMEISYHKGFGLMFWLFSLPSFVIFCVRNRKIAIFFVPSVFLPALYIMWSITPTIHVQARFLMWFVLLTFPLSSPFMKGNLKKFVALLFFVQLVTNFLKMKGNDQPMLWLSPVLESARSDCILHDRFFLKYSYWFGHLQKVSTIVQVISEASEHPISIRCVLTSDDTSIETQCPFLFAGPIRKRRLNRFSSCLTSVHDPDVIILISEGETSSGQNTHEPNRYVTILDERIKDARGHVIRYRVLLSESLHSRIDKIPCLTSG